MEESWKSKHLASASGKSSLFLEHFLCKQLCLFGGEELCVCVHARGDKCEIHFL